MQTAAEQTAEVRAHEPEQNEIAGVIGREIALDALARCGNDVAMGALAMVQGYALAARLADIDEASMVALARDAWAAFDREDSLDEFAAKVRVLLAVGR